MEKRTPAYQDQLKALWRAIAQHFRDEPTIAGYDLVNEPSPPNRAAWSNLAEAIISEIRAEDTNHLIIVERALEGGWGELFLVSDTNVMYDVHLYLTQQYCLQFDNCYGDGGYYPDPEIGVKPLNLDYLNGRIHESKTPTVPPGNSVHDDAAAFSRWYRNGRH